MAIAWVSNTVAGCGSGSPCTTKTINKPASVASGDLLLLTSCWNGDPGALTPPTGFTLIRTDIGTGQNCLATYYRVADGTEGSTFTFSWVTSRGNFMTLSRITGAPATNPIATVTGFSSGSGTGTKMSIQSITGIDSAPHLFFLIGGCNEQRSYTPDASMTEQYDDTNSGGPSVTICTQNSSATSTGTKTDTVSSAGTWTAQLIVIGGVLLPEIDVWAVVG